MADDAGRRASVALLDTGIDLEHPAFAGRIAKDDYVDFTDTKLKDYVGHGSHCAGIVFGSDVPHPDNHDSKLRIGIARGMERPLIAKVLDRNGGSNQAVFNGALWALQKGAHIVCMSLGLNFKAKVDSAKAEGADEPTAYAIALSTYRENLLLFDRIVNLANLGPRFPTPLFIAASGNGSLRPGTTVGAEPPAASPGVVSVGAIDGNDRVWRKSNTGPTVAAPGVDIWSAKAGGGVVAMSGTSMAAPHVAGVAAVLADELLALGQFTPVMLRQRLLASLRALPDARIDVGDGMPVIQP